MLKSFHDMNFEESKHPDAGLMLSGKFSFSVASKNSHHNFGLRESVSSRDSAFGP
jgi:hypothetical protein